MTAETSMHYLIAHIPEHVRSTFTAEQLFELKKAARGRERCHSVDIRLSIPVPCLGRFYVSIIAGREKRNHRRLVQEGLLNFSAIALLYGAAAGMVFLAENTIMTLVPMDVLLKQPTNITSILMGSR